MLSGKKISLRPFEEKDIEKTVKWLNDIDYAILIDRVLPATIPERKEWFYTISKDKSAVTFAVVLSENGTHIGNCGLINIDNRSRRGQLWIYLDEQFTGHGMGKAAIELILKYAFHYLNLHRVFLYVVSTNLRAKKFYEKCGFTSEGIFREHVFLKNRYEDAIWLGMLKQEFDEQKWS
jgi:RimJ/RimL family protein N-acetyltransferase